MVSEQNQRLAFRTHRLALRSVTRDDFRIICAMENPGDESASALEKTTSLHQKLLSKNHLHLLIYLLPETQYLSSSNDPSPISWEDAGSGTPIGNAGMMGNYELGYLIAPAYRSKGYASEAVVGILGYIWRNSDTGTLGMFPVDEGSGKAYVSASVDLGNVSSVRVLQKVGAVEQGDVKSEAQSTAGTEGGEEEKRPLKRFRMYKPE